MNRPLRLTECSLLYICAINGYYGMFVAIHLRYPFRYFYLLYPTFRHVHPVGVGADLSCPCPRNSPKWRCIFALLALQFISFRHIKTIWFGLKNGRDESAPTPYGMFVAIHLRYPFRYFYLLYPTFRHVHPVGVGADLSCPCPRTPPKMALRIRIVGVAIHHTVPT